MNQDSKPAAAGGSSFTGVRRQRKTKTTVKIVDALAKASITIGGIGTICAVALVCVFLVAKVIPLFTGGTAEQAAAPVAVADASPVRVVTDEYGLMTAVLSADGRIKVYSLADGTLLVDEQILPADAKPSAWSFAAGDSFSVGFEDGSVAIGNLGFSPTFLDDDTVADVLHDLALGEQRIHERGIVERTPEGQLRLQALAVTLGDPIELSAGMPIKLIDHISGERKKMVAAVFGDGSAKIYEVRERKNLMTGKIRYSTDAGELPAPESADGLPVFLGLTGLGDNVWQVWGDGTLVRYNVRRLNEIAIAETVDLTAGGSAVRVCQFLNGKATLLVGTEQGTVSAWFKRQRAIDPDAESVTVDAVELVRGHEIQTGAAAVTAIGISSRTRLIAVGHEDGDIGLFNVTTESEVARVQVDQAIDRIDIAPKDDGIIALAQGDLHSWRLDAPYHEVSPVSLILPVHYESATAPATKWQTSSGDDAFEPKYGLWPLVFGTLKATFYALMFGVPIALMAAIYTSEFLHPRAKSVVKPTVEMMASLPSVVLGFIGGIVIATWVEDRAAGVVLAIATIPISMLLCARVWQLLPRSFALRWANWRFLPMLLVAVPFGVVLARMLTPSAEYLLFAVTTLDAATGDVLSVQYDLKTWLSAHRPPADGQEYLSSSIGGWMFILWPLSATIVGLINARYLAGPVRDLLADKSELAAAIIDLVRFGLNLVAGVVLAVALSWLVSLPAILGDARSSTVIGWLLLMSVPSGGLLWLAHIKLVKPMIGDRAMPSGAMIGYALGMVVLSVGLAHAAIGVFGPLDSYVGTYIQRNALVVGFIMGFAIIPIIYTIAEDALSSVPTHLRSASLGAGATPWQTAVRIIVPTAMSGVFSAIMIGLGRAVGETMIVLMATGNTPVESMNIFDGLRTLAANIAVELPEAPKDGTHYRVLFFTALVLFAMTFVLNTVAEAVRQRFRKRAFEL
ncbi:MAG: ABC transporter permease subunit [Planctomycetota bacterium]|jgi:phosphate transport system permease protein|nr:ABC transporter permease subunit [Planctomycetota bacterium]